VPGGTTDTGERRSGSAPRRHDRTLAGAQDCHRCGQPLGYDLDDERDGGPDGLPFCGECARNRDEAADLEASGLGDGEIDRVVDDW
jgi:hypothetical protein